MKLQFRAEAFNILNHTESRSNPTPVWTVPELRGAFSPPRLTMFRESGS